MYFILLLEDDPDDQYLFKEALVRVDPTVSLQVVANGEDGLKLLDNMILKPDLIVSDINMPKLDGISFVRKLREMDNLNDIPVILISTSNDPQHEKEIASLGAYFFIKPTEFNELRQIIREAVQLIIPKKDKKHK